MGWQRHQLDHMQIICTSLRTDNHATTSPLSFYGPDAFLPTTKSTTSRHVEMLYSKSYNMFTTNLEQIYIKSSSRPTSPQRSTKSHSLLYNKSATNQRSGVWPLPCNSEHPPLFTTRVKQSVALTAETLLSLLQCRAEQEPTTISSWTAAHFVIRAATSISRHSSSARTVRQAPPLSSMVLPISNNAKVRCDPSLNCSAKSFRLSSVHTTRVHGP